MNKVISSKNLIMQIKHLKERRHINSQRGVEKVNTDLGVREKNTPIFCCWGEGIICYLTYLQ